MQFNSRQAAITEERHLQDTSRESYKYNSIIVYKKTDNNFLIIIY